MIDFGYFQCLPYGEHIIYEDFRDFIFVRDATVMLMGRKCLIFGDFLLLYDTVRFIRFYLPHYHLWLLLH